MFRVLSLALIALLAMSAAVQAAPKTKLVELRVEGDGTTLEKGTWYATRAQDVKRGRNPECDPRRGTDRFPGASALTVLAGAQDTNPMLRPVRVRPTDFGPQACQIGDLRSFGTYPNANAGFLYWVDYVSGFSSPDLANVGNGQRVLWYYSVFPSDPPAMGDPPTVNTGLPLELRNVPARDADGEFVVQVVTRDFGGTPTPLAGATVIGAESVNELGGGSYEITVPSGRSELFAVHDGDVRSNRLTVCVGAAADCPVAHGRRIVGSRRADRLPGTAGDDVIRARGGDDRINLRKGGRDRVNCGRGDDVVLLKRGDRNDRVRRNCERIRRR